MNPVLSNLLAASPLEALRAGGLSTSLAERATGLVGIAVILGIAWLASYDHRRIPWRLVVVGLGLQAAFGVLVLKSAPGRYSTLIDRLFDGYARTELPTDRFDDISSLPKQVKTRGMSPLCHTSVSKWSVAAGTQINSKQKKERCAKVTGEVVYQVVSHLNEYLDGKWTAPKWSPKEEIAHCWKCHGSDDMWHDQVSFNNQQGHMDCLHLPSGSHKEIHSREEIDTIREEDLLSPAIPPARCRKISVNNA